MVLERLELLASAMTRRCLASAASVAISEKARCSSDT
jgi:hypothetical protein